MFLSLSNGMIKGWGYFNVPAKNLQNDKYCFSHSCNFKHQELENRKCKDYQSAYH